jgi:hypothetical protein
MQANGQTFLASRSTGFQDYSMHSMCQRGYLNQQSASILFLSPSYPMILQPLKNKATLNNDIFDIFAIFYYVKKPDISVTVISGQVYHNLLIV